jgi:hypothetical protein
MRSAIVIAAILLATVSCHNAEPDRKGSANARLPTVSSETTTASNSVAPFVSDSTYLQFKQLIKVETSATFDRTNPHQIASYSVSLCQNGATDKLLRELGHVEKDEKLGSAFTTYIREFGPELERFKDTQLYLKFEAYQDGSDTSVWYYYLVNSNAEHIEHKPWISIHRSKYDGSCSLTGIFLNDPGDEVVEMPQGLKRS